MDQTRDNWTEKRIDRLETRLEKRVTNLEDRHGRRIDGVYSTIMWTVLSIFAAFYVVAIVIAAVHG